MIEGEAQGLSTQVVDRMIEYLESVRKDEGGKDAAAFCAKGKIFGLAGHLDHAEECYKRALSMDPTIDEAAARLVMIYIRSKRPECALDVALRLLRRNEKYKMPEISTGLYIGVHSLVGLALLAHGNEIDAREAFSRSYAEDRNDSLAWAYLVQLGAEESGEKLVEFIPADGRINPRFEALADQLRLTRSPGAPSQSIIDAALRNVSVEVHGRPLVDEGQASLADLTGSNEWSIQPQ